MLDRRAKPETQTQNSKWSFVLNHHLKTQLHYSVFCIGINFNDSVLKTDFAFGIERNLNFYFFAWGKRLFGKDNFCTDAGYFVVGENERFVSGIFYLILKKENSVFFNLAMIDGFLKNRKLRLAVGQRGVYQEYYNQY